MTSPTSRPVAGRSFESLPSPLGAVDDLRSAAKWALAAAGTVGAVLISGGPLVAVGQVHGTRHALLAGAGLILALGGVGLAIWAASRVLAPRLTTPTTLRSKRLRGLRRELETEPEQFFGTLATTVSSLLLHQAVAVDLARKSAAEKDLARRQKLEGYLRKAEENALRAEPYVQWLLELGHVWGMQLDLRRSRWCTLAGGVLVVSGAVLFFLATANSGPVYVPVLAPSVTATPHLTASPRPPATP
jgi:hypothetical protein